MTNQLQTSVAIIGAGPAGLTLAHLLASQNINVTVIEKLPSTIEEPRAIGIDSETLRTLQAADCLDFVADEIFSDIPTTEYLNADGKLLFDLDLKQEQPYGHAIFNTFDQPPFDRILADTLRQKDNAKLLFEHQLYSFEQHHDGVTLHILDGDDNPINIIADFMVGCDGGRSTVREQLGITMTGSRNEHPWLVVDTIDPAFDSGPASRFFCDPARPGMTIKRGKQSRRWEWMLMPGESPEALLKTETIHQLLSPYTDVNQIDIYRRQVYNFSAVIAESWQVERVFLAGDAAHMTPPFAGQGLNSGMRDVRNLSWKLAMVINRQAPESLLESYTQERWQHAQELINFALSLGEQIQPIDPEKAAERDNFFFELQKDPLAIEAFGQEMAKSVLVRAITSGIVASPQDNDLNGQMLPQPIVTNHNGDICLLDDILGKGFSIVGFNCRPEALLKDHLLHEWKQLGTQFSSVGTHFDKADWVEQDALWSPLFETNEATMVLIRPDKFCLVAFTQETAHKSLEQAKRLLQLS